MYDQVFTLMKDRILLSSHIVVCIYIYIMYIIDIYIYIYYVYIIYYYIYILYIDYIHVYTYILQPKFSVMESSIRDIFIFGNRAGAWKTIIQSAKKQ